MLACVSEIRKDAGEKMQAQVSEIKEKREGMKKGSECKYSGNVKNTKEYEGRTKYTQENFKGVCFRCGLQGHMANSRSCPALKSVCNKCGKVGHYMKCCRSTRPGKKINEICECCGEIVLQLEGTKRSNEVCVNPSDLVKINGKEVKMYFDSCSRITIIPKKTFEKLKGIIYQDLMKMDVKPGGYGGTEIPMCGYFKGIIEYKGKVLKEKIYVSEKGDEILG